MMITNFSSGELSGRLSGRVDLPQYYAGASLLKNFDVIPTGGITRRCGTERIAHLAGDCRLIPFIIDRTTSFILEIRVKGNKSEIRFWKDNQPFGWSEYSSEVAAVDSPWVSLDEIRSIQYAQNYNTMIFVSALSAPFMLTYDTGLNGFTAGEMSFDFTPNVELDDDYDWIPVENTLPSAPTESGYCVFKGFLWKYDDESGKWEKDDSVTEYELSDELFTTESNYPSAVAFFNGRLFFASTLKDRQKVWASAAPNLSGTRYNQFSTYTKYVTVNKVVKDPDVHFFTADTDAVKTVSSENNTETVSWTGNRRLLKNVTQNLTGIENLSDYYVTSDVTGSGTKVVSATWDENTGKGTVTLSSAVLNSGEALVFSIQKWQERTTASAGDYEYKIVNSNMTRADDGFFFEVASDQNDAIKWLATSYYLVIGTESGMYVMTKDASALSQSVVLNGRHGTDALQATVVDRAVVYFSQGLSGIREYYWNNDEEAFRSNDLALLCPEMLSESPACDFDFMTNPYARILVTREDGSISVLLYEKNSGVMAWARYAFAAGKVTSVSVTRGDASSDFIYLCIEKDGEYYLEKLDIEKKVYLDSHTLFTGNTEGYEGNAVIFNRTKNDTASKESWDGWSVNQKAAFMQEGDEVYIGYTYESRMKSMPIIGEDPTGKKRITKLCVRFYDSERPVFSCEGRAEELFPDFSAPFTGIKSVAFPGESSRDAHFTLSIDGIGACTVLAVNAILDS